MTELHDLRGEVTRLRGALDAIVKVLGPEEICECSHSTGCGLADEAFEALHLARQALDRTAPH